MQTVMTHFDEAYNLARWLTGSAADAEDVVQESLMKAFRLFTGFRGPQAKPWLLTIVRRTSFTWLAVNRPSEGRVGHCPRIAHHGNRHASTTL